MARYPSSAPLYDPRLQPYPGVATGEARIAHYSCAPAAVATILAAASIEVTGDDPPATVTFTQFGKIDIPRVLDIIPDTDSIGEKVVITGTDAAGRKISETIAALEATTNLTKQAYKALKSVEVTAGDGDITIKTGKDLGLPSALRHDTVLRVVFDNTAVVSGSGGYSIATDAAALGKNLLTLPSATSGAFNGKKLLDVYFLVPGV